MDNKEEFATFIKGRRGELGLSQVKMGEALGVSWVTIWRWENQHNMPKEDAIQYWRDLVGRL